MLPINLDDIGPTHIQAFIDSEVAENIVLEYKEQLPGKEGDQKREFLYDVAAFANAAGGDLVYGIVDRTGADSQSTGVADRIAGIKITNEQSEVTRLSNLIRDGIAPRLVGVRMRTVSTVEGDVLVIRIPRSWNKPHMVTINGVNKFYIRTATGKAPMSVDEIRRAFSEQGELRETIGRWREHRAALIENEKGPVQLGGEVTMLFHIIPADSFGGDAFRESWRVSEDDKNYMHVPYGPSGPRYNADGFICLSPPIFQPNLFAGYTQIFRSGIVEYSDSNSYRSLQNVIGKFIFGQEIEKQIVLCYKDAINRFRRNGRTGQAYVGFSFIGVLNKTVFGTVSTTGALPAIRHNVFTSPEVLVDISEPEEFPYRLTLLPLVNTFWQMGGRERTPFIPNDGDWDPFRHYL
jgi:hypothetical protein